MGCVALSSARSFASNDGIAGLTSTTLDSEIDLKQKVMLPDGVQLEQLVFNSQDSGCRWIYSNLMDFVETTNLLYDSYPLHFIFDLFSVVDVCTPEACPEMAAGPHYSYYWTDFNGSSPVQVVCRLRRVMVR